MHIALYLLSQIPPTYISIPTILVIICYATLPPLMSFFQSSFVAIICIAFLSLQFVVLNHLQSSFVPIICTFVVFLALGQYASIILCMSPPLAI